MDREVRLSYRKLCKQIELIDARTILSSNLNDLQKYTNLPLEDINNYISKVLDSLQLTITSGKTVADFKKLPTNCKNIDEILKGGIPINGITEIYGCSGVGKTQFCAQIALTAQLNQGMRYGVVYICTEDVFPSRRFHEMAQNFKSKYHDEFEANVFIEHIADYEQLRKLIVDRLPFLLKAKPIKLLVIDSIAAIFRSEKVTSYTSRSKQFVSIVDELNRISDRYGTCIICVNQVQENIEKGIVQPSLGLSWSNLVTNRFCISRDTQSSYRKFSIVFSPNLPPAFTTFNITSSGIE